MTNNHSNRTSNYYITVLFFILIPFLIFFHSDLSAKEKASGFVFNPKSEYWPTKGWKTSTPEKQGVSSEKIEEMFRDIKNSDFNIESILIVRNGYIVVEANKRHFENLYPIYSSTKSFTSAVIGIALSKGHIRSVEQTVSNFFPELSQKNDDSKKASITLKHLLTMSCGFEWPEVQTDYFNIDNPVFQMMISENWINFLFSKPVKQEPGLEFNYNSKCTFHLPRSFGTGKRKKDLLDFWLSNPLGKALCHHQQKSMKSVINVVQGYEHLFPFPISISYFHFLSFPHRNKPN